MIASFVLNMAFLGVVMFMPLYMQVVQGINATQSGVALLPLMAGLIVSNTVCGRLVSRTGRYKPFMVGGGIILAVGVMLLTGIDATTTSGELAWRLAITGIGLGPAQNLFGLVIQNAVPVTELGGATSMSQFSRQMGSTVGVAIFGTLLVNSLTAELPKRMPLLPGHERAHRRSCARSKPQAMNVDAIRARVAASMQERQEVLERAFHEDREAIDEIVADSRMPTQIREAPARRAARARACTPKLVQTSRRGRSRAEGGRFGSRPAAGGSEVVCETQGATSQHPRTCICQTRR